MGGGQLLRFVRRCLGPGMLLVVSGQEYACPAELMLDLADARASRSDWEEADSVFRSPLQLPAEVSAMETTAVVIPVKPGKRDSLRNFLGALAEDWAAEEQSFNRRFGIQREVAWLQEIDGTDHVILYQEVDDPKKSRAALEEIMTSDEPFPAWFRENLLDLSGGPAQRGEKLVDRRF